MLGKFLEVVDGTVKQAFDAALKVLAGVGCEIIDFDVPEVRFAHSIEPQAGYSVDDPGQRRPQLPRPYVDFSGNLIVQDRSIPPYITCGITAQWRRNAPRQSSRRMGCRALLAMAQ